MAEIVQREYSQNEATDLDLEFHRALVQMSGHKRVQALWEELSSQTRLLLLTHRLKHPMDLKDIGVDYHRRVVEAVSDRDTERALEELHKHLRASFDGIVGGVTDTETPADEGI